MLLHRSVGLTPPMFCVARCQAQIDVADWLNQDVRIAMRILILEIANGIAVAAAAPVFSIILVSLGRLVLVMHLTLIGYDIGYFHNQDPRGYPDILI